MGKDIQKNTKNDSKQSVRTSEPTFPDYVACEMFLEQTGFFSPSSKRLNSVFTKEKRIRRKNPETGEITERVISIMAIHHLGLPVTFDQDLYLAFLKICDEAVDPSGSLPEQIEVPTKKLLRYAAKVVNTRNITEAKEWFKVMTGTLITGEIYDAKQQGFFEATAGTVFSQVKMRGDKLESGEVAHTNLVWLSPWFRNNYEAGYTRHFDLSFYTSLRKPIAKALFTLLQTGWYASSGHPYTKSYSVLAGELLLQRHSSLALVKQQLEPAHRELQRYGFLEKWEYRKRKGDILVVFYPGKKWFNDQKARLKRKKSQSGQSLNERGDEQGKAILESSHAREEERKCEALRAMRQEMNSLGYTKRVKRMSEL